MIKWDKRARSRLISALKNVGGILEDFLSKNADLIDSNKFDELYNKATDERLVSVLTALLLISDIDFLSFMKYIPTEMFSLIPLHEIIVPEGVIMIMPGAFDGSFNFKKCTLPKSMTFIYSRAFVFTGLTELNYKGTMKEWYKINRYPDWNSLQPSWVANNTKSIERVICSDGVIEV